MSENQMTVGSIGLLSINKKIANLRKYKDYLINKVGTPLIENNSASNFDSSSYFLKSGLTFTGSEISVMSTGKYYRVEKENHNQVFWFLSGDNSLENNIVLQFSTSTVSVVINHREILKINHLNLSEDSAIKSILSVSENFCSLILNVDGVIYKKETEMGIPVDLSIFNKLYLGNDPTDGEEYWCGSINLDEFSIYQDNTFIYSPSASYSFTFSKILLSDGEFTLADDTVPIAKHVFRVDFEEITRMGSSILFMTQINEDVKLTIKEVGLYINIDGKEVLFGVIKGLNIDKGGDVPYDLIFTLNTSVEFVNVVGFPDENSFLLKSYPPVLLEKFRLFRELLFYIISSLERMVYENAQRIGYNKAQEYYKLQQDIELSENCCSNIQTYSRLFKKLQIPGATFDSDKIEITGNPTITNDGVASNFSDENFISTHPSVLPEESWEFTFSFKTPSNIENKEVIVSIQGEPVGEQPPEEEESPAGRNYSRLLVAGIEPINSGNYFFLKLLGTDPEEYIISNNEVFEVEENQEYFVTVKYSYTDAEQTYSILKSTNGINYTEVYSTESTNYTDPFYLVVIGGNYVETYNEEEKATEVFSVDDPFSGEVPLAEWEIFSESGEWNMLSGSITKNTKLLQYYAIPNLYKSAYKVEDLNSPDYYISILENTETGNRDLIDFSSNKGISLGIKVYLKNSSPKVILGKTDLIGSPYFVLSYLNNYLTFTLYSVNSVITVTKKVEITELAEYQDSPIMLFITLDGDKNLNLYKNNELIGSHSGISSRLSDATSTFLTNYVQDEILEEICNQPEILNGATLEEYIERVKSNQDRCVQNILVVQGVLSKDMMYYINNLMDTNF